MNNILLPAVWLIVLIVGLPQFSETVYTPSLPDIAHSLGTSDSMVEYTLSIFLFGFAVGTAFWGNLSDKVGRKPSVLAGLCIFIIGCICCFFSSNIHMLLLSRFIQAFGGSIGSVLGQAICRDSFSGSSLGKVYASIGSAIAIFPAIGPVIGGVIAERFGWSFIFIVLLVFGIILSILIVFHLPETHLANSRNHVPVIQVAKNLFTNKKVIGFGLIVACCNGILVSYFAEGSFYLIEQLGLSPSEYGLSFILIATSNMLGALFSRRLHNTHSSNIIMNYGIIIILISELIFSYLVLSHIYINPFTKNTMVIITILSHMCAMFGYSMANSNALALSLADYKDAIGTASSLFGFFYYILISLFTLVMGMIHNGSLLPMPLYFLVISIFMFIVSKVIIQD